MADGEERDANLATVQVHGAFDVHADRTRTLVQDSKLWLVIEQSRHLHNTTQVMNQIPADNTRACTTTVLAFIIFTSRVQVQSS